MNERLSERVNRDDEERLHICSPLTCSAASPTDVVGYCLVSITAISESTASHTCSSFLKQTAFECCRECYSRNSVIRIEPLVFGRGGGGMVLSVWLLERHNLSVSADLSVFLLTNKNMNRREYFMSASGLIQSIYSVIPRADPSLQSGWKSRSPDLKSGMLNSC